MSIDARFQQSPCASMKRLGRRCRRRQRGIFGPDLCARARAHARVQPHARCCEMGCRNTSCSAIGRAHARRHTHTHALGCKSLHPAGRGANKNSHGARSFVPLHARGGVVYCCNYRGLNSNCMPPWVRTSSVFPVDRRLEFDPILVTLRCFVRRQTRHSISPQTSCFLPWHGATL